MKKMLRTIIDFDFALFCSGASGFFVALTLIHLVNADFLHASVSAASATASLSATLYGRKTIGRNIITNAKQVMGDK